MILDRSIYNDMVINGGHFAGVPGIDIPDLSITDVQDMTFFVTARFTASYFKWDESNPPPEYQFVGFEIINHTNIGTQVVAHTENLVFAANNFMPSLPDGVDIDDFNDSDVIFVVQRSLEVSNWVHAGYRISVNTYANVKTDSVRFTALVTYKI